MGLHQALMKTRNGASYSDNKELTDSQTQQPQRSRVERAVELLPRTAIDTSAGGVQNSGPPYPQFHFSQFPLSAVKYGWKILSGKFQKQTVHKL